MYKKKLNDLPASIATVKKGQLCDPLNDFPKSGRLILKNGLVVDPKNQIEEEKDIIIYKSEIYKLDDDVKPEKGDQVIHCNELLVIPGLIDLHLHLGDLFEITTEPIISAVNDGVTVGLSPGAGNTLVVPALVGAEVDRGLPINIGVFLGAPSVLGTSLTLEETIKLFKGEPEQDMIDKKLTRNNITNTVAPLIMGLKEHMGHYIMSDENYDKIFDITSKAGLLFMSHTQDPEHTERLISISRGRPVHLGHATAAGCGTHGDPVESMEQIIEFCKKENVSAEFVTSQLRIGGGNREGLRMDSRAQELAYQALEKGIVNIINSDGQSQATMKGFGDTRDNIPAILELAEMGVLSISESIATMTSNPAKLIAKRTRNNWWVNKMGHLGEGALANVTIIDRNYKRSIYTIVNGEIVSFESRHVRSGNGAGGYVSKFGMVKRTGVGDLSLLSYFH